MQRVFSWLPGLGRAALWVAGSLFALWTAGVAFYCTGTGWAGLAVYAGLLAWCLWKRKTWGCYVAAGMMALLQIPYWCMQPRNDRDWQASWSQMPEGEVSGDLLTLRNIRDFRYRTQEDFDVRYITQTYDLNDLVSLDFAVSHWDGMEFVSHTLLSFGFRDGRHLALSAETRLDRADRQGAIAGLYNQFELLIIFATEQDILALRSNYRHEDLYLYRFRMENRAAIRTILLDFVRRANELRDHPRFYNTVTNNCTTALRPSMELVAPLPSSRFSVGSILNGYVDRKAFDKGFLMHRPGETFEQLRRRSQVPRDIAKDDPDGYTAAIRRHITGGGYAGQ